MILVALLLLAAILLLVALSIRSTMHTVSGQLELMSVQLEGIRDSVARMEPPDREDS